MVSLRRGPRPSYNVAEKLALSDDEQSGSASSDGSNAEAGPSKNRDGPSKRRKVRVATVESSGAESAFIPPDSDVEAEVEEEDVEMEDAAVEESPEPVEVDDDSDDLVEVDEAEARLGLLRAGVGLERKPVGQQRYGAISETVTEYSMLDAEYQLLEWREATFDPRTDRNGGSKYAKPNPSAKDWVPHGPMAPLGKTRLASKPRGRALADVIEGHDLADGHRQKVLKRLGKFVPVEIPWDAWEGEPWCPATSIESSQKGKKTAKPKSEYSAVGRYDFDAWDFLSKDAAEPYLPKPADKKGKSGLTCLMGQTGEQKPVHFDLFDSRRVEEFSSVKKGFIFMAGGPIWGLDWCPMLEQQLQKREWRHYLAVSTLPSKDTHTQLGEKRPADTTGCIQIWSMLPPADHDESDSDEEDELMEEDQTTDGDGQMRCEMVLCIEGGSAIDLKWAPREAVDDYEASPKRKSVSKLGILAATLSDGTVSLFSVSDPSALRLLVGHADDDGPLYVKVQALVKAEVEDTVAISMDWRSDLRLAVGFTNGYVGIYDMDRALSNPSVEVLPVLYTSLAQSSFRSVTWIDIPDVDSQGKIQLDRVPPLLMCASIDGSLWVLDTRDPKQSIMISRSRIPLYTAAWLPQLGLAAIPNPDYGVETIRIKTEQYGRGSKGTDHLGAVWSVAGSEYHAMLATGSADGSLAIVNAEKGARKTRRSPLMRSSAYEMDYDSKMDLYRMTDDVLPINVRRTTQELKTGEIGKHKNKLDYLPGITTSYSWLPEVGIHRAVWNNVNGIARAGLLLSGGASGLARIDVIKGQYRMDRNIWDLEVTRGEAQGDLDELDDD